MARGLRFPPRTLSSTLNEELRAPAWAFIYKPIPRPSDPAEIEKMRADALGCDAHNHSIEMRFFEKWKELRTRVLEMWGEGAKELKYFDEHKPQRLQRKYLDSFTRLTMTWNEEDKKREAATAELKKKSDDLLLTIEATKWLESRGKVVGVDFSPEHAVGRANDIAFEEEVARRQKEMEGLNEFIDFPYSDNCENCSGWDGHDRRCECGNVRVCWTHGYRHSFKEPSVEPENF